MEDETIAQNKQDTSKFLVDKVMSKEVYSADSSDDERRLEYLKNLEPTPKTFKTMWKENYEERIKLIEERMEKRRRYYGHVGR